MVSAVSRSISCSMQKEEEDCLSSCEKGEAQAQSEEAWQEQEEEESPQPESESVAVAPWPGGQESEQTVPPKEARGEPGPA